MKLETKIKKAIAKAIEHALTEYKVTADTEQITIPPSLEFGDFAYPCFKLAKDLKKDPKQIAKDLESKIKKDKIIDKAVSKDGYINFYINPSFFYSNIIKEIFKEKKPAAKTAKKIMIEYSSPNPCKSFHVGHLRNTILGKALANLYEYKGNNVIKANYLNDTGSHIAKVLWIYLKKYNNLEPKIGKGKWLGELYIEANRVIAENIENKKAIDIIHQKLDAHDKELISYLNKFKKWSQQEFDRIYEQLGVDFDVYFYDSDYINKGKEIVNELIQNGIAKKSEGAVVVDLEQYGLHTALILKSDGSSVYITKDFAMAKDRFNRYKADKIIYVVGSEQILHFKQLFKILQLYGFKQAKNCAHLPYELVRLKTGKISSRAGGAPLYSDLYELMFAKILHETQKRHKEWKGQKIDHTASAIALSAIKYDILKCDTNKVIVFDPDKALAIEGDTGPYLLYTVARINSILKKCEINEKETDYKVLESKEEKDLMVLLSKLDSVINEAYELNKPSLLANYILELAHSFNHFYHVERVVNAETLKEKMTRAMVVKACGQALKIGLNLLNIMYLDEM